MHIYAKCGAAPSNTQISQGLTMVPCSKPEHQRPLHHTITCSEWKDPDKSQNPIPPTSPVGEVASPHRETTNIQELQGTKERNVGGSQQSTALGDPSLAKLLNSAPLSLKVKNTVIHVSHAKTHFPSSLTSAWLCLGQGGRLHNQLFSRESQGLSYPPQGHLWGTHCNYT